MSYTSLTFTGAAIDLTVAPPVPYIEPSTVGPESAPVEKRLFIEEHILDEDLRAYLAQLVKKNSFIFDAVIDEKIIIPRIAAHWPHAAHEHEQTERLWERIDHVVRSIPVIKTAPVIMMRVIASSEPLVPQSIPSPHGYSTLATFDAETGRLSHCIMPGLEELPPLDTMKVSSGLMVIAQPVPGLISQFADNRGSGFGAANIYTERARDMHLPQHKVDPAMEPRPSQPGNNLG